jgi:hypothetical protein
LYTREAELCFFYGEPLKPILARQKTFLDGWVPIAQYDWRDGAIRYNVEIFSAVLDGEDALNTCQFARLAMRNVSSQSDGGQFAAAMRRSGGDHRYGRGEASPDWKYAMIDEVVYRDDHMIYTFSDGAACEAVPGVSYRGPFSNAQHVVTTRSEVCLVRYQRTLRAGESFSGVFKMPRVPLVKTDQARIEKVRQADYANYREKTKRYWRDTIHVSMDTETRRA